VLKSRSELNIFSSQLPGGDSTAGNSLACQAQIFDAFDAFATSPALYIKVNNTILNTTRVEALLNSQFSGGVVIVDNTKKVINTVSLALNTVDCSKSPNCTSINRYPNL